MAFREAFTSCLRPLPTPGRLITNPGDVVTGLLDIHSAWSDAGGDQNLLMKTLVATGAVAGIDFAAIAALGGEAATLTVAAYLAACATCAVSAAGSLIWQYINACQDDVVKNALVYAANNAPGGPVTA